MIIICAFIYKKKKNKSLNLSHNAILNLPNKGNTYVKVPTYATLNI